MTEIAIHGQQISVAPGDHVDVLMIDQGQESIVLQDVEVLIYAQKDNIVELAVTKEDAERVMQTLMQTDGRARLRLRRL